MPYGILAADQIQSSVTGVSLGAGNATRFKNRIINGDMRIDQRNAGASVTGGEGTYTLDRWISFSNVASKYTVQRNAGAVTPPTGFTNYLGVTSTSAYSPTGTNYFLQSQKIEGLNIADLGWGTANAKTVTLSFWVRSSLTGTFGGSITNDGYSRSYPFSYTINASNTWEYETITLAGDTSGTWLTTNGIGLNLFFSLGMGTAYSGPANAWAATTYFAPTGATSIVATNGATLYITGVQLEVGSIATGFEYVDYMTQLAMCYRYYRKYVAGSTTYTALGTGISTTAGLVNRMGWPLDIPMRTAPTVSVFNTVAWNGTVGGAFSTGTQYSSATVIDFDGTTSGMATGTLPCKLLIVNDGSGVGYVQLNGAEL